MITSLYVLFISSLTVTFPLHISETGELSFN